MDCFVFRSQWDANLVTFLRRVHHETVQKMIRVAQQESGVDNLDDPDDIARGGDEAVLEHLEHAIRDFVYEDAASTGLMIDADPTDFYGYAVHDVIERIDFRTVAMAIYFGVDPGLDRREFTDPDFLSDTDSE